MPDPGFLATRPGLLMHLPAANAFTLAPAQATPRADIEQAARELETQFAHMLIKSMRSASPGNAFGGDSRYRDMYDQQLARELAKGRGLGLAPMITRQLERGGGAPAPAPAALPRHRPGDSLPALPLPLAPGHALPAMPALAPSRSGVSMGGLAAPAVPVTPSRDRPGGDAPFDASSPEAFVRSIWPQAQKAAAELGVPAKALVAQAALETGWGRRLAGRREQPSMNLFGIKASGGWNGARVSSRTHEFVAGRRVEERADFRAYGSVAESFADYTRLIGRQRYAAARGTGNDVQRFASALQQAGYATDPAYAAKITAIANGATLNRALASMPAPARADVQVAGAAAGTAAHGLHATTTIAALAAGHRG